jgi:hypothetical protein
MPTQRWRASILVTAALGLSAEPARPQSLGLQVVGARSSLSLLGNLIGIGAQATVPLRNRSLAIRLGLERLTGGTDRIGTPCAGLIEPGTCAPEPVHDDARATTGSIGVVMLAKRWNRIALAAGGDLGLATEWRPTNVPIGVELGVGFGGLTPVTVTALEDGYTPFERASASPDSGSAYRGDRTRLTASLRGGAMAHSGVFSKLQLRDQKDIVVLDAPAAFEKELRSLEKVQVHRQFPAGRVGFALAFMTKRTELDRYARQVGSHVLGDAVVWVAYPKGSSKRYTSELGRDAGWQPLGALGYEPVRMIAIDEDWSGLRFRKAEFIKALKRGSEHAISQAGKAKARKGSR